MEDERSLDDWIGSYLKMTDRTEPSLIFREWVAASCVAAVLQRKCYLHWEGILFPNLYVVLTGGSGWARKGTALRPGKQLLSSIGLPLVAEKITTEALIKYIREQQSFSKDQQTNVQSIHSSVTVMSQEFSVFLGHNNPELISILTDLYDHTGETWEYKTKTQGVFDIQGPYINLIGATTPELMQQMLPKEALAGGLLSRIIFVYSKRREKVVAVPHWGKAEEDLFEKLKEDLDKIYLMSGQFEVKLDGEDSFLDEWIPWYSTMEDNLPFDDPRFNAYFSRRPVHILKLCMIMSASEGGSKLITARTFRRALDLLSRTELYMQDAFGAYGRYEYGDLSNMVLQDLVKEGRITMKYLMNKYSYDADDVTLAKVVAVLKKRGLCELEADRKTGDVIIIHKGERNGGRRETN